jgi:PAS domain S-box-containing protein
MRAISVRTRTLLYSLAIFLLLVLFALLIIYIKQTFRVKVTKGWVHHTLEVISTAEKIHRLSVQDAMGLRGYIITNDSSYLQPSIIARKELQFTLNELKKQVAEYPSQSQLLQAITDAIQGRIHYADSINRMKAANPDLSNELLANGSGLEFMNTIESRVNAFQLHQYRLLQARQSIDEAANEKLNRILLFLLFSLFIFTGLFFVLLFTYVKTQERLAEEGQYINELLRKISDAVILMDGEFNVTDWNQGAEDAYGITPEYALGRPIADIISLTKSDFPDSGFETLQQTGQWNGEIHKFSITGKEIYMQASISLIRGRRQHAVGCVAVMHDITFRKQREKMLTETNEGLEQLVQEQLLETREANTKLKDLNARLERSREEERKKISRELHDDLGQTLTGAKIHLSFIKEELNIQDPEMKQMLENLIEILNRSIQSVRNLSMELRPALIEELGLFNAIKFHANRFTSQTQITVEIINDIEGLEIDPSLSVHVFRIFQEALNNISKHARASHVITHITMEDGLFKMQISDDGEGFDIISNGRKTLGLTSMQERSEILNGTCQIESTKGRGTIVRVKIPMTA